MRKLFCLLAGMLLFFCNSMFAQQHEVTGKVTDANGAPINGASIKIKGSREGTATSSDGTFKINASEKDVLIISAVGNETQNITVGKSTTLNVSMVQATSSLNEVVVTALGIRKEKKALGYAVSTLGKTDLELRAEPDLARILNGKAPGVNIGNTSGLSGSGTNIVIRGVNTITGNTQPLFVIDGVPFDASTNTKGSFVYGNQTTSRFFDIDPNNIESVSVLKGLSATTLYGEQGANGVILITTKNGSGRKAKSKSEVTVTQSYFVNQVANLPEYNDVYGGGFDLSVGLTFFSNWGAKFTNPPALVNHPYSRANLNVAFPEYIGAKYEYKFYNSVKNFFRNGSVSNTGINFQGGKDNVNYNLSYSYLDEKGFVIGNGARRNTFGFGGSAKLSNKLTVSTTANFVLNDVKSPPTSTSFGSRATVTSVFGDVLYTPTAVDLMNLPWENPLDHSHVYYRASNDIQNPRWTLYNSFTKNNTSRYYGQASVAYEVIKNLNVTYRLGVDNYTENALYAQNKGGYSYATGILRTSTVTNRIWDHTLLVNYKKDFGGDFDLTVDAGINSRELAYKSSGNLSRDQLVYGLLDHSNFVTHDIVSEGGVDLDYNERQQTIAAFLQGILGYKGYAYLTLAGRNSWSSTLEEANRSIFYPNVSLSFIPTSAFASLKTSKVVNYLKVRLGYSASANFPSPYQTRGILNVSTRNFIDRNGNPVNANALPRVLSNPDLKPELANELEAGLEGKLVNNRVSFDFTFYDRKIKDQILNRPLDPATGYTSQTINAGKVSNKGVELGLGYTIIKNKNWRWQVDGLFAKNKSNVSDIPTDLKEIVFAGYTTLGNFAINGQPLGVIKGYGYVRDVKSGQRVVQANGDYQIDNTISILGDPTPDFKMTGITEVSYKFVTLRAQFEYTKGGDFYSATSSVLLGRGVTQDTRFDRAAPYILPGVKADGTPNDIQISATQAYFDNTVAGGSADEAGIYDGTVYRLREASLAFQIPEKLYRKTPFGAISFTISGSNLWYYAPNFPKYVHFDPETNGLGVGNGRGLEFFTGPSSRRFGASIRVTF
ncbi:MAG: SusC/RagA family TonB-linked outer membrane protein [Sphingobacteriales bacterium]|nr:SusC/RagA family TonB-linked outer membrane protein [Sphingobacteriales bacterium]